MILYRPTDGDARDTPLTWRPRTAFLMTQLGEPLPEPLREIRRAIERELRRIDYALVDADSQTTGKDFLLKIWEIGSALPLGIALLHEDMRPSAIANVFYELGMMQAYGKETLVVKTGAAAVPSDFVRTEYVPFDGEFKRSFRQFAASLQERADYYELMSAQLERNPLLAIDYLRRGFLLTGEERFQIRARELYSTAGLDERAVNSVETFLVSFAR